MNWSNNSTLCPLPPHGGNGTPYRPGDGIIANMHLARGGRHLTLGICLSVLLGLLPPHAEAKKKRVVVTSGTDSTTAQPADATRKQFDIPIPVNHDAKGVRIPSYDPVGKLLMYFNIATAFRVDDGHLRMTNLKIETYGEDGKVDLHIDMPASSLDLITNIISSVDPITINRSDFQVTGANMTFNTQTRQGKFSGPVRMLIFNQNELDGKVGQQPRGSAR